MKVIQICTSKDQLQRGAEKFCLNLSRSLATADHNITLVTGDRYAPILDHLPFTYHCISEKRSLVARKLFFDYFNPLAARSFREIVEKIKPDLIHFHSFYGLSTALLRLSTDYCPVIVTLHDSWLTFVDGSIVTPRMGLANSYFKVPLGYIHRHINKISLKKTTLVSPSLWMKDFFETTGFQSPVYIPNGIERVESDTTYENTILWVGTVDTFKGLPSIISTLAEIIDRLGWQFIVVGDGPCRCELEKKYPQIHFAGYCDPERYYKSASILVVSSIGHENFPTVVLEGMQHALCVVGHNLGGIAELIKHNETGILYESVNSLYEILLLLTETPERIRDLGNSAKIVFNENYRWDSCFKAYLDLYSAAVSNH